MRKSNFIYDLKEIIELEDDTVVNMSTVLIDLEEFDSLAIMSLIAYIDLNFGVIISGENIFKIKDVASLIELIGEEHFE